MTDSQIKASIATLTDAINAELKFREPLGFARLVMVDKKPHIYRLNGKWYCRRRYPDGWIVRTALGAARNTPLDAFVAWCEWNKGGLAMYKIGQWEHLKKCSDTVKSKS